ncbi:regulator [Streptomyces sp. NPDC046237]|uniref:regulator n=1 Tax=Streptomyces sp. NPDC046237 TaxID=3154914 RepID=UPI0033ED4693
MTTLFTSAELHKATAVLASPPLVRLITEIDDNGAIPPRRLAGILHDLSPHHLRCATETARDHGLVRSVLGVGLELTEPGSALADLYDATARWARRHNCPQPVSDFSSRVRYTFDLLASALGTGQADGSPSPATEPVVGSEPDPDLDRLRTLLLQWLTSNPQVTALPEPEPIA